MDIKLILTKHFANEEGISVETTKDLNELYRSWWNNTRKNGERSFALSGAGFDVLSKHLKFYQVDLPNTIEFTNYTVIWLDKFIDCPYYLTRKSIYVSREKVAVQLILFSGDLNKFGKAKHLANKIT